MNPNSIPELSSHINGGDLLPFWTVDYQESTVRAS